MDYSELERGINYFEGKCPDYMDWKYAEPKLRQRNVKEPGYWSHLERMNPIRLAEEIIDGFLNPWGCRIPSPDSERGSETVIDLRKMAPLHEYYAALSRFKIEEVDFQGTTTLLGANKDESSRSCINYIYSRFRQVKGFGPTVASKLMYMAIPDLFVMCDRGIIQRHCIPKEKLPEIKGKKISYVAFLILMQENIRHIIETHPRASDLKPREVIQDIRAQHNSLPLPRLLDMANMAVRDCEQAICISCMKKAKARWDDLDLISDSDWS